MRIILTQPVNSEPWAALGASIAMPFHRYKNVLALSQVFPGGGNLEYQLPQGHPEKVAAKTEQPTKQTVTATAK